MDWRDFEHHLENLDMSETQKRELIQAYAAILLGFVELGFGISAGYMTCEKDKNTEELSGNKGPEMLL